MNWISFLLYILGTGGMVGLIHAVAIRKSRPIYGEDLRLRSGSIFRLAAILSAAVGLLLAVFQSFAVGAPDLLGFTTVSLTAMVSYLLVLFAYTDHVHRMADRVLLRAALAVALILGIARLIELQSEPTTVIFAVGILLSFAIMFVPSIGASDARAFMLLFAVGIPILGTITTYYVFLIGIGLWLAYGIVSAIAQRSFKVSIPLVPYILLPLALAPIFLSLSFGIPRIVELFS